MIEKTCPEHGRFTEVYWTGVESYLRAEALAYEGAPVQSPQVQRTECPTGCGLCPDHLSSTQIAYIDITNRCDLNCPICFANANTSDHVYELPLDRIRATLDALAEAQPLPTVFFTGGEPTIHPAFLDAVEYGARLGFPYFGAITNGVRLGTDPAFASACAAVGLQGVILSFDGLEEATYVTLRGRPLLAIKQRALDHCRAARPRPLQVGFASTIANGVNDHEVGALLDYVLANRDIVRLITYLPITFQGKWSDQTRARRTAQRFTLAELTARLVEQTEFFRAEDVHPASTLAPISALALRLLKREQNLGFGAHNTTHPHCGFRNYLIVTPDHTVVPLSRIIDMGSLARDALSALRTLEANGHPWPTAALYASRLLRHVRLRAVPRALRRAIIPLLLAALRGELGGFKNPYFDIVRVRGVHFQDAYNFDLERIKRCSLHYALPDGRLIPSCLYNTVPWYRQAAETPYSKPTTAARPGRTG